MNMSNNVRNVTRNSCEIIASINLLANRKYLFANTVTYRIHENDKNNFSLTCQIYTSTNLLIKLRF